MAAVARQFPPRPTPRLVPMRLPEKSANHTTEVDVAQILEMTSAERAALAKPPPVPKSVPAPSASVAIEYPSGSHEARLPSRGAHPGVTLLRTIGFFLAQIAEEGFRNVRVYVEAHWARASSRVRGGGST